MVLRAGGGGRAPFARRHWLPASVPNAVAACPKAMAGDTRDDLAQIDKGDFAMFVGHGDDRTNLGPLPRRWLWPAFGGLRPAARGT